MPAQIVFDAQTTYVTDPVDPCAGQDFTVSWQEKNAGDADSDAYQDSFTFDADGTGNSQILDCDPVSAGCSVTRSLKFNLPEGDYTMTLVINGLLQDSLGNVIVNDCAP